MAEPTRVKQRKKLGDGSIVVYESWRGSFTDSGGVRRQVSLGNCEVVSENEARRRLNQRIREDGTRTATNITLRQWCDEVIHDVDHSLDEKSVSVYELVSDRLCDSIGAGRSIRTLDTRDVGAFMAHVRSIRRNDQPLSAFTVLRHFVTAKAILARATRTPSSKAPFLRHNPFDDVEPPSSGEASPSVYVSPEACWKFIDECPNPNWTVLFVLARLCAMRAEEALSCSPQHFDWENGVISVPLRASRIGKGAGTKQKPRIVPMSPAAEAVLRSHFLGLGANAEYMVDRQGLGLKMSQHISDGMRIMLERAGVRDVVKPLHDLRKSQAHDWAFLYGPEESAEWCGHSVGVAFKSYRRDKSENLALVTKRRDPKQDMFERYARLDELVLGKYGANKV